MEQPKFVEPLDPNVILRNGPLDGGRIRVEPWVEVELPYGGQRCTYKPTGEMDDEFDTLAKYVFDHAEPA